MRAVSRTVQQVLRQQTAAASTVSKIGSREVVGFGFNGSPSYIDRVDFPMPAIRFRENTPDIMVGRIQLQKVVVCMSQLQYTAFNMSCRSG